MHRTAGCRAQAGRSLSRESSGSDFMESPSPSASSPMPKMNLHLGVLHYSPLRCAHFLDAPACLCVCPHMMHQVSQLRQTFRRDSMQRRFGRTHHVYDIVRCFCSSVNLRDIVGKAVAVLQPIKPWHLPC